VAIGVYPGSFDPLTIAHLAVADAAFDTLGLDRLDLAISYAALGKEHLDDASVQRRLDGIRDATADRPWLEVVAVREQLIVDIAEGYDAVVVGADKWRQVNDPAWYDGDPLARDAALARLPRVLVAPRAGDRPDGVELLDVHEELHHVSATAVRDGARPEWLLPEAERYWREGWQRGHQ